MALNTDHVEIYVPLLDEGVSVWRPTKGEVLSQGIIRILATPDYDPEDEKWAFTPGTLVKCETENRDGEDMLIAKEKIRDSS